MPQPLPQIKCKSCGELFIPKRPWQEFCNDKCRNNYHNDKKYGVFHTEQKESIKCPYCKSESDNISPNIIEQISSTSYLCNVCARTFPIDQRPDFPPFSGLRDLGTGDKK